MNKNLKLMMDNNQDPTRIVMNKKDDIKLQRTIARITEETSMRQALGEEKYARYETLAKVGKFERIHEEEMHKDYHAPSERLGQGYAANLFFPRHFFRARYDPTAHWYEKPEEKEN